MQSGNNEKPITNKKIELKGKYYTPEKMAITIAAKQLSLQKKGQPFTCFTLNDTTELTTFFSSLLQIQTRFSQAIRFQFVYSFDDHWTSADVCVESDKIKLFLLDSINSNYSFVSLIQTVKQSFPDANIVYTSGILMQEDWENCGTFALDYALQMALIPDLHPQLSLLAKTPTDDNYLKSTCLNYIQDGSLKTVLIKDFPITLGPLLRNIQSTAILHSTFYGKGYQVTRHSVSLENYVSKYTQKNEWIGYVQNCAIDHKRKKFKRKAISLVSTLDESECNAILNQRTACHSLFFTPPTQSFNNDNNDSARNSPIIDNVLRHL